MDRKSLSKSAPAGRRNSRNDKSSTMKEINQWISKGHNDNIQRKVARNVSSLTENVTEERMLYARQLELGRERYKFLNNHEYEKQKFVERQQQKDKMMKQFMASARKVIDKTYNKPVKTLTVKIPQMEQISVSSTPVEDECRDRTESRTSKVSRVSRTSLKSDKNGDNAAETPRLDSRASRTSSMFAKYAARSNKVASEEQRKSVSRLDSKPKRELKVNFVNPECRIPAMPPRGAYINTSDTVLVDKRTESRDRLPSVSAVNNERGCRTIRNSEPYVRSMSSSPDKGARYRRITFEPRLSFVANEDTAPKWAQTLDTPLRFGHRFVSSIADPRYIALTSTLARANDVTSPSQCVKEIIAQNDVFKHKTKIEDAVYAKQMHAKFIALLLQNELK